VRNAADDWKVIGASEPWYGVLSAPEFLKANITEEAKERFYQQGQSEIDAVAASLRKQHPDFAPRIGLDFGTGLGRQAFPMAKICYHVYGLDISPDMLAEASRQATARNAANVTFCHSLPENLNVDWINTFIVMQHIPPRIGYQILNDLLNRLNVGGFTSIHLTYAHDSRYGGTTMDRDIYAVRYDGETMTVLEENTSPVGQQSMFDYDLNKILFMFTRKGVSQLYLEATDHGGNHGFWILGRKIS
jgi:SAM-dependent methyltransferase